MREDKNLSPKNRETEKQKLRDVTCRVTVGLDQSLYMTEGAAWWDVYVYREDEGTITNTNRESQQHSFFPLTFGLRDLPPFFDQNHVSPSRGRKGTYQSRHIRRRGRGSPDMENSNNQFQRLQGPVRSPSRFRRVCVFCGSSPGRNPSYQLAAIQLGKQLVLLSIYLSVHAVFVSPAISVAGGDGTVLNLPLPPPHRLSICLSS